MKLFFKSKPLELPALTRLRDPIEIAQWWVNAEEQYKDTLRLLLGFNQRNGGCILFYLLVIS
ncbi:hypothetical protein EBR57_07860 [bacterium]|nr:hypothetical protein [bacterium]